MVFLTQACPRGYRPDSFSQCRKCDDRVTFYDALYLGFMALLSLVLHWSFIDALCQSRSKRWEYEGDNFACLLVGFISPLSHRMMLILNYTIVYRLHCSHSCLFLLLWLIVIVYCTIDFTVLTHVYCFAMLLCISASGEHCVCPVDVGDV